MRPKGGEAEDRYGREQRGTVSAQTSAALNPHQGAIPPRHGPRVYLSLSLVLACWGHAMPEVTRSGDDIVVANRHVRVVLSRGALRSVQDAGTGTTLLTWPANEPCWYVEFGTRAVLPPVGGHATIRREEGQVSVRVAAATEAPDAVDATVRVTVSDAPWVELDIELTNRSSQEVELVGFPGNTRCAKGEARFLVLPYQSGGALPLDERFGRIRVYGQLPFVVGYPGNLCSMQWLGAYGPNEAVMLMSTDRYGALKRMGAVDAGTKVRLVCEQQLSLAPGASCRPPPWRILPIRGDSRRMCEAYRTWVRERTATSSVAARDTSAGATRVPLQFMPIRHKIAARPHLSRAQDAHGYPEHAVREDPKGQPFAYLPYGMTFSLMDRFRRVYSAHLTPQIWSPFVESGQGWRKFPHRRFLEEPLTDRDVSFPGMSLHDFLAGVEARADPAFLYVNPSFWPAGAPGFEVGRMFDRAGDGVGDTFGGFEAGASGKVHYVCPSLVGQAMVEQLRRLAGAAGDQAGRANGLMFDSSQVFGATLWNNSRLRRDPNSCIDRNPRAHTRERYGYVGRDAGVQDKLQLYLALHEATPHAVKVGEWIGELETLFMDINAGSVCLKREYPDAVARPADENLIPLPLFQMVYGDSELFVVRVGAASDAHLGKEGDASHIPADVSRRGSAMFGAVHQVLFWGGVRWAGPVYDRLHARTWMVVRDNAARAALFGRQASFRMLAPDGAETTAMFAVRETSWVDAGTVEAVHWDNNSGAVAPRLIRRVGSEDVSVGPLWAAEQAVPSSLGRLREGSTVTLTRQGTFALWHFAGSIATGTGRHVASVTDSQPTPRGLAVVWDGHFLSVANESAEERTVTVVCQPGAFELEPLPPRSVSAPGGAPLPGVAPLAYSQALEWDCERGGAVQRVRVRLGGASRRPDDRPLTVPATLAVFRAGRRAP